MMSPEVKVGEKEQTTLYPDMKLAVELVYLRHMILIWPADTESCEAVGADETLTYSVMDQMYCWVLINN